MQYVRFPVKDGQIKDTGPYEAIVVSHLDPFGMGTLEVELLRVNGTSGVPERSGQLLTVRYLSPFYGVTPFKGLTPNDDFQSTQKSYGMWMIPPDPGARVLVIFAEGHSAYGYWIGCIPETGMNFTMPDPRASTANTTESTPQNLKGLKVPVGEYNKTIEQGQAVDPTLYPKPYNKDFTEILEVQGLIFDEARGTTTSSARREVPSMVFGISTPGPMDKRKGRPTTKYGHADEQADVPFNRLGGSSFVMDDGDDKFVRATHPADGPPLYVNKEIGDQGGDETIPQNEVMRFRTRTGHQIVLHNSEDLIYIANSRGTAWIELSSDGKIDIHAEDSISLMTNADFNVTAERDINMEAGRNINMRADGRWPDHQKNYYNNEVDDEIRNGQVVIEALSSSRISSGVNSTHFEITEGAVKLDIDADLILQTAGDMHLYAKGSIYQRAEDSVHETAGINWYRKAKHTMVDQCEDYFAQVSNNSNFTIGNDFNTSVEANKNVRVNGTNSLRVEGNNNEFVFSGNLKYTEGNLDVNTKGATKITSEGQIDILSSSDIRIQGGPNIRLNEGAATAAIADQAKDASAFLTQNSPQNPDPADKTYKLTPLTGQYGLPGEKVTIEYDTIVPRAPQHEPWAQHENLDPIMFKSEFTDRERPGALKNADRILTPDTFLKNKAALQSSVVVAGTSGQTGYNVGAYERLGKEAIPTGPATGKTTPSVTYMKGYSGQTRNKPIQDGLLQILDAAANKAKVEVVVFSGGQEAPPGKRRTGSRRHDNGYAADVWLYNDGQRLNTTNSNHLGIIKTFVQAARSAGATAIGAGNGYMGNTGIHLDIAKGQPGVSAAYTWGGRNARYRSTPTWLRQIMEGG